MSSSLDAFLPKVLQHAPGCAEPAAFDAIRSAAIEFCRRTRLWQDSLTCTVETNPVQVIPDQETPPDYSLVLPEDAQLLEFGTVMFDGLRLEPATTAFLDEHYSGWRTSTDASLPKFMTQVARDSLFLVPRPDIAAGIELVASVYLMPTEDAATLPDFMAAEHREDIAHGALARLLVLPGQPFSNPNMAAFFTTSFENRLDELFMASVRGKQRAPARTKPNYF